MKIKQLQLLEETIDYDFCKKDILKKALTHTSYANENNSRSFNNERLEFLGDAVLEVVTSEFLYFNYKKLPEGELTKLRAKIVCESTLAFCSRQLNLGDYLFLGKGEDNTGGRDRNSILSDAFEAVIGAIFLDGGIDKAKFFVTDKVLHYVTTKGLENIFTDYKTKLQELVQKNNNSSLEYNIISESGPDHNKQFTIGVFENGNCIGEGFGKSKKIAEQSAAQNAIEKKLL